MNISLIAAGTRGDVQPYVALGKGLSDAGNRVKILTTDDFEGLIHGAGLEFASTGESMEHVLQSDEWRKAMEGGNFFTILGRMQREMKGRAQEVAQRMSRLLEGSELIVAGMGGMTGGFSVAEKLDIPVVQAYVFPITPTREFPSPLTPTLPFGKTLNGLSFHAMQQMLWQSMRVADVTTRRVLGMAGPPIWGPFGALRRRGVPLIYGYSRHVLPRPQDWDANYHVSGYWFLDGEGEWSPPQALQEFLVAGAPPVYIGFGSMGNRNPQEAGELALKALALAGQRGVLASGWGGLSQGELPETVFALPSAPHSWLFPQMAAVVHHGGAGTTAAGLRAGVPSIVVPFMGDQPFWGQRVARLGVGPAPIARRKLTAEALAAAIVQAMNDQGMRDRAATLGEKIRAEDGVGQAVALIEQLSESRQAVR